MITVEVLLMIVAIVLLGLATAGVGSGRFNLGWGGMFCWAVATLLLMGV